MTVAFHKGLSHELILRMQQAGMRIEEVDAQRALAGLLTREIDARGNVINSNDNKHAIRSGAAGWILAAVDDILDDSKRFDYMRQWEEEHPGKPPFPIVFPEKVLALLEHAEEDEVADRVREVIELARGELLYG